MYALRNDSGAFALHVFSFLICVFMYGRTAVGMKPLVRLHLSFETFILVCVWCVCVCVCVYACVSPVLDFMNVVFVGAPVVGLL
jgi:hypothetical protein